MTEPFKLNFAPAQYGGVLQAVFHDLDGYQCRLRGCDSESLTLGLVGPRDFGTMHLNREQTREIGLALIGFAETGKLGESRESAPQNLQDSVRSIAQKLAQIQSLAVDPEPIRQYINQLETQLGPANERIAELEAELEEAKAEASMMARSPEDR